MKDRPKVRIDCSNIFENIFSLYLFSSRTNKRSLHEMSTKLQAYKKPAMSTRTSSLRVYLLTV